jgi:hypothetical protein
LSDSEGRAPTALLTGVSKSSSELIVSEGRNPTALFVSEGRNPTPLFTVGSKSSSESLVSEVGIPKARRCSEVVFGKESVLKKTVSKPLSWLVPVLECSPSCKTVPFSYSEEEVVVVLLL